MLRRVFVACSMFVLLTLGVGCSGSSGPASDVAAACGTAGGFCLANCNLGCSPNGGCTVTDIAPNQPIELQFSQVIDESSINSASVSIRTPGGQEPVGALVVEGNLVRFLPEVRTVQGSTFFGFTSNETYIITLPGGAAPNAVESTAGDRLNETFTCEVRISREVIDLDETPPTARLVAPEEPPQGAPRDSVLVLEFDEFIDAGPFFGTDPTDAPIRFRVRRTRTTAEGVRECDPLSAPFPLSGSPRLSNDLVRGVTQVEFAPIESLPPDVCLEAEVTTAVRDISGRRAVPGFFRVVLEAVPTVPVRTPNLIAELPGREVGPDFLFDEDNSGGTWDRTGETRFASAGGDGRHGRFILTDGDFLGADTFQFNTGGQILSGIDNGNDLAFSAGSTFVDDGRFYFTEFVVPEGTTVRFIGDEPLRLFVRGRCQIDGRIEANGLMVPGDFNANPDLMPPIAGQAGSLGGPGGGAGGDGAFSGDQNGDQNRPEFNDFLGFPGEDAAFLGGDGFGLSTVGTGGQGGVMHPPGNPNLNDPAFASTIAIGFITEFFGGVGSGGGFVTAGGIGTIEAANLPVAPGAVPGAIAPDSPAGSAIAGFVGGKPMGVRSDEYFLVGGAGGGGGGTSPFGTFVLGLLPQGEYWPGGGGAGGGGAVGLFVGGPLEMGPMSLIDVSGGDCGQSIDGADQLGTTGYPAAGGGGSGGSLLIQVDGATSLEGTMLATGGEGAPNGYGLPGSGFDMVAEGGDGGEGFIRIETAGRVPNLGEIGTLDPMAGAANVGELAEANALVGSGSLYFNTLTVFAPIYERYEIEAMVDGVAMTFSDDMTVGTPAIEGEALQFWVQGVDLDPLTNMPILEQDPVTLETAPQVPAPWRRGVGFSVDGEGTLNGDGRRGFRFALIHDTREAAEVIVNSVIIQYRN